MRKWIIHIVFWGFLFFAWYRVGYFYMSNTGNRLWFALFDVITLALSFYLIFFWVTPLLFYRRNKVLFALAFVVVAVLSASLIDLVMRKSLQYNVLHVFFKFSWNYNDLVVNRYYMVGFGAIAGLVTKVSVDWLKGRRKLEQLEKEKAEAELYFLKGQLNPHFLFNALNTIYVQMDVAPEKARHTLHQFSCLLRYQLYEGSERLVPLEKEIEFIEKYVAIQQLRFDHNHAISFCAQGDFKADKIYPWIFTAFIENGFKYISYHVHEKNILDIRLFKKEGALFFQCMNTKDESVKNDTKGGIGLQNTRRRLELLYPQKHKLAIEEEASVFKITLKLIL